MRATVLLAGFLLGVPAVAQVPLHAVATVNDPRSHGQIGDSLLSLEEAILLHNRMLQVSQLSPAEQQQISFIGGDIALADIDTTVVTTVTLERDLTPIANMPHGLNLRASPYPATIVIGNTNGFLVDSDFCDFRRLVIRGGAIAVRVAQRDTYYGTTFELVRFEGQTQHAVQCYLAQDAGETFLRFENCTFAGAANGVRIDDLGSNRRGVIEMRGCTFDGGNEAFVLNLGPGGSSYTCRFDRSSFQNLGAVGIALRRASAANDRAVVLDLVDLVSRSVPVAVAVDGHPTALTDGLVRMVDLAGATAALRLGGSGSNTKIAVEDAMFAGPVTLAGRTTLGIDNARFTGGTLALATVAGTAFTVARSAFAGVTTTVAGGSAASFTGCRFDGGSIAGSASSPVTIAASYVGATTLGANTSASGSLPGPQLGTTRVWPQLLPVGQTADLDHDLPPGYVGFWLFGLGAEQPSVQSGMRLYIDTQTLNLYPGAWRGQGRVPFPMPPIAALRGLNLVFQMLVGHDVGVPGPLLQMPPGGRVLLR